jgi:hypothetical protein
MREQDMRQRVQRFLQTRLRSMLAPATIGLGLAMTACPSDGSNSQNDGSALVRKDAEPDQQVATLYMGPLPRDAQSANGEDTAAPDAAAPDTAAPGGNDSGPDQVVALYIAPLPRDAQDSSYDSSSDADASSADGAAAKYIAPIPDAAREFPMPQPDYMAQIPDSGVARYMAVGPDAGPDADRVFPMYMAQLPLPRS